VIVEARSSVAALLHPSWSNRPVLGNYPVKKKYLLFLFNIKTYNILAVKPLNNHITPVIEQTPIQSDT
jgi:hypothetical protein